MDRYEAQEVKEIMAVKRNECPRCATPLEHFEGILQELLRCPKCRDRTWNSDGEMVASLL